MARSSTHRAGADTVFRAAVEAAECLNWKPGLQAISASEGKGQIVGTDPNKLVGSAFIDQDCRSSPVGDRKPRWDYVVGYDRSNVAVAHFVEVHSANPKGVGEVADKLQWLRDFLERDAQASLKKLRREYHWIASGKINIPKHVPQYRILNTTLRRLGLQGPVKHLTLA
jgi:hypothetical protein